MPARLRPTAPVATDAILVGDPGRALMLAQALLQQPKMSNHARGLWGYSGRTPEGRELTIQATGMGGPSAAVVLRDLAELGLRRAVRIGTGASLGELRLGEILVVERARPFRGPLVVDGGAEKPGKDRRPDPTLTTRLRKALPEARAGVAVSLDTLPDIEGGVLSATADVADMQTATLLATGAAAGLAVAALLIVTARNNSEGLEDEELEVAARRAGAAASGALST